MELQKRLAAQILKVGKNRIYLDASRLSEIKDAITKQDIRELIKEGAIKARRVKGISRGRFRKRLAKKKKGRSKGAGSRKGKRVSKRKGKQVWVKRVRLLRRVLMENKAKASKDYGKIRKEIRSGNIKNKKQLLERIAKAKK